MISTLILLSASLLTTPVFISDVKASREAGHLRVDVRGDGGIDPDAARTVIDDGRLIIYLRGTRVRANNRAWELQDGAGEIRAHRHRTETELVVPLTGNGCAGPVELTGSSSGITALVGCEGAVVAQSARRRSSAPKTSERRAPDPKIVKPMVEAPRAAPAASAPGPAPAPEHVAERSAKLAEALALPAPVAVALEPAVAPAPAPAPVAPIERVAAATPVTQLMPAKVAPSALAPQAAEQASASAPVTSAGGTGGGLGSMAIPALLLAALAVGAYIVARRRRGTVQRHIEILETTSLGPKRSLVVARIGDETVVLGTSEAGITLLRGSAAAAASFGALVHATPAPISLGVEPPAVSAAAAVGRASQEKLELDAAKRELEQPLQEALADIPEPDGGRGGAARSAFRAIEGGLAGLFDRRGAGAFDKEPHVESFEDLLEDSVEDQELRRKLAAGMSARVR